MPTQPISKTTSRAETSIEASASVTLLTSPQTTLAKPCEHFGRVLLFANCRYGVFSETYCHQRLHTYYPLVYCLLLLLVRYAATLPPAYLLSSRWQPEQRPGQPPISHIVE